MNEELSGASDEPSESRRRDSVQGMLTRLYGGEGAAPEVERLSADLRRLWPLGVIALAGLSTYGAVAGLFGGGSQPAITFIINAVSRTSLVRGPTWSRAPDRGNTPYRLTRP